MITEMSIIEMEQMANFYMTDLFDMIDENANIKIPETSIHGLRHDEVSLEDYKSISEFGRIIMNYQKIKNLTNKS